MTSYNLIQLIRRRGGDIRLGSNGQIQIRNCPEKLKPAIQKHKLFVVAWLKEERASKYWEASGKDPQWWRSYPFSHELVSPCCTCPTYAFPHIHSDYGPPVNCTLAGEDAFASLRKLVKSDSRVY